MKFLVARAPKGTLGLHLIEPQAYDKFAKGRPAAQRAWLTANGFEGKVGQVALLPSVDGIEAAVAVVEGDGTPWSYVHLPGQLPARAFRLLTDPGAEEASALALGWALASYAFERYRPRKDSPATLVWPKSADRAQVTRLAEATTLVRDLINTPAGDLGPAELADAAKELAATHKAKFSVIVGKSLEKRGFPAVYAVGKGSPRAPRLIDMTWGRATHPKVTLVGKGVVFDTGGLDLKSAGGMLLMKKDMGGAAQVLGLAHAIMDAKLPVRLRVLVPAVENSISGEAFRPSDVISTGKGLTVEVGNTDAEGRLVLADALFEACKDEPEVLLDFATLTGAARVALGTDVPALFCNADGLADDFLAAGKAVGDQVWRMPLWDGYRSKLDSKVADINNIADGGYGGAITAALFLKEFVSPKIDWAHLDLMAYNLSHRPGRPAGGEAMGIRAAFTMLEKRYSATQASSSSTRKKGNRDK